MSTIRWSPMTSHICNGSPGTIVVGSPGSGKTFFMINVAANCLAMGQRVIVIDPKNDFEALYNVNKNVECINVSKVRPGALNPFTFLRKTNKDGTLEFVDTTTIMTVIECLCGRLKEDVATAITPIVKDFVTASKNSDEYVDLIKLADYLYQNQHPMAQAIGNQLKMYEDHKLGKLLFIRKDNVEPLVLSPTSSIILTLHGMKLPGFDKKPSEYSNDEKLTSTIIYLLTKKLYEILQSDNTIPTVFICDEAQMLFANPEMAEVIDQYLRLGRSLNVATILASQGITSFPEKVSNNISSKFLFKSSIDEAQAFLSRFDTSKLDPSKAVNVNNIVSACTRFTRGICYFIDRYNRNGIIEIKSIYNTDLLTSNPFEKARREHGEITDEDEEDNY